MGKDSSIALLTAWACSEILISATSFSSQVGIDQTTWTRDTLFDGRMVEASLSGIGQSESLTATTRAICAAACLQRSWCRSFFHKASASVCRLHTDNFDSSVTTVSGEGFKYFKNDEAPCPTWRDYTLETYSGLCYKVHTVVASSIASRSLCHAENASLVTLDTDLKVQGIMAAMTQEPAYTNQWFHVGASRPADEWDTTWDGNSNFFQWEKTGQAMSTTYFLAGQPNRAADQNCIDLKPDPSDYTSFTQFTAFADGTCEYNCYFICEIY